MIAPDSLNIRVFTQPGSLAAATVLTLVSALPPIVLQNSC